VLAQFSWENQFDSALHLPTAESVFLVVSDQLAGFHCDPVETVVDERVHDAHRFLGDSGFGVHLLQDFVDVDAVGLNTSFASFFLVRLFGDDFGGDFGLRGGLFGWHFKLLLLAMGKIIYFKNLEKYRIKNFDWIIFNIWDFIITKYL
jgi:hypothetical protein